MYHIIRYPKYSDWQVTDEQTVENSYHIPTPFIYNCDADIVTGDTRFFFTQTMFNNDDKYEYIVGQ